MAQFKPEYLNCLPEFRGNPNDLNRFNETLINLFYDVGNLKNFQNIYSLNSIVSKLKGKANAFVKIQRALHWIVIKNVLIRNFWDRRDEICLNRDLAMLEQSESFFNFLVTLEVIHSRSKIAYGMQLF